MLLVTLLLLYYPFQHFSSVFLPNKQKPAHASREEQLANEDKRYAYHKGFVLCFMAKNLHGYVHRECSSYCRKEKEGAFLYPPLARLSFVLIDRHNDKGDDAYDDEVGYNDI